MGFSLGKFSKSSIIPLIVTVILLVVGSFSYRKALHSDQLLLSENLRDRVRAEAQHPLLTREATVSGRSGTKQKNTIHLDLRNTATLSATGIDATLPSFTGAIDITTETYGSLIAGESTLIFSGTFTLAPTLPSGAGLLSVAGTVEMRREEDDLWYYLDTLHLTQSGMHDATLFMGRSLLNSYKQTWIHTNQDSVVRDLLIAPIFSTLAAQAKQHVVPELSGELILLIEGKSLGLSGVLTPEHQLDALLRRPQTDLSMMISQLHKKQMYQTSLYHTDRTHPLFVGITKLDQKVDRLELVTQGTGQLTNTFGWTLRGKTTFEKDLGQMVSSPPTSAIEREEIATRWANQ